MCLTGPDSFLMHHCLSDMFNLSYSICLVQKANDNWFRKEIDKILGSFSILHLFRS